MGNPIKYTVKNGSLPQHNNVSLFGHVSKIVSILLSKLSVCPNTDTSLRYYKYPFLTRKRMNKIYTVQRQIFEELNFCVFCGLDSNCEIFILAKYCHVLAYIHACFMNCKIDLAKCSVSTIRETLVLYGMHTLCQLHNACLN